MRKLRHLIVQLFKKRAKEHLYFLWDIPAILPLLLIFLLNLFISSYLTPQSIRRKRSPAQAPRADYTLSLRAA